MCLASKMPLRSVDVSRLASICLLLGLTNLCVAEEATVAVATNFLTTAKELTKQFELDDEGEIKLVSGSTGQLFAQISNGARFHVFMSADQERASKLVSQEMAVAESQFTYASGRLCFFVSSKRRLDEAPDAILTDLLFDHVAIANPRTAPYGDAAMEVLAKVGLEEQDNSTKVITAQNVGQAYSMVSTGNSHYGIVALSSILDGSVEKDQYYLIPSRLHKPILQDAVLLMDGADNQTAKRFLSFLASDEGKAIIRSEGYKLD